MSAPKFAVGEVCYYVNDTREEVTVIDAWWSDPRYFRNSATGERFPYSGWTYLVSKDVRGPHGNPDRRFTPVEPFLRKKYKPAQDGEGNTVSFKQLMDGYKAGVEA